MSLHTICDKCLKVIDGEKPWVQITQTTLVVGEAGSVVVDTPSATYDYHPNHAPKLTKGEPEAPPEVDPPHPDQTLPEA